MRVICGETIVMGYGKENIDFSKIISLNESAAYLWRAVEGKDFDAPMLAHQKKKKKKVDEATALRDAEKVMCDWQEAGLVS